MVCRWALFQGPDKRIYNKIITIYLIELNTIQVHISDDFFYYYKHIIETYLHLSTFPFISANEKIISYFRRRAYWSFRPLPLCVDDVVDVDHAASGNVALATAFQSESQICVHGWKKERKKTLIIPFKTSTKRKLPTQLLISHLICSSALLSLLS